MTLQEKITQDMKDAMRARQKERLGTIRLLQAAIKQKQIDEGKATDDADIIGIIERMVKQRKDSIAAFANANRQDLVDKESAEIEVLTPYLPARLSAAELQLEIQDILARSGANSMRDMGKAMAMAKEQLAGKADMAEVSRLIKSALHPI